MHITTFIGSAAAIVNADILRSPEVYNIRRYLYSMLASMLAAKGIYESSERHDFPSDFAFPIPALSATLHVQNFYCT